MRLRSGVYRNGFGTLRFQNLACIPRGGRGGTKGAGEGWKKQLFQSFVIIKTPEYPRHRFAVPRPMGAELKERTEKLSNIKEEIRNIDIE